MSRLCAIALCGWLSLLTSASAQAQEETEPAADKPKGPADLIGGAQKARSEREMKEAVEPGDATGSATPDTQAAAAPRNPHATAPGTERKALTETRRARDLSAGQVRVRVVDQLERPVSGQTVVLGILGSDGSREQLTGETDASGAHVFAELDLGARKAYRANVPYQGAKYSSDPFRLPSSGGFEVLVRRLPVTQDDSEIVLYVGATSVELKDDRLKIVQQARLYNLGHSTYAFPEPGKLVHLPDGFMALQSQDTMTDQKIEEAPGEGLRIHGSLLPGETTLLWGFDLPSQGDSARFTIDVPWKTFAYRVVADAPPGLSLDVEGFPEPIEHEDAGRRYFVTEIQRKIGERGSSRIEIRVDGIPGPGPLRWVAAALSLLAIAGGLVIAFKPRDNAAPSSQSLQDGRQALIERARLLQKQRDRDEIGPSYYQEQMNALRDELATLLLLESRAARPAGAKRS